MSARCICSSLLFVFVLKKGIFFVKKKYVCLLGENVFSQNFKCPLNYYPFGNYKNIEKKVIGL